MDKVRKIGVPQKSKAMGGEMSGGGELKEQRRSCCQGVKEDDRKARERYHPIKDV